MRSNSASIERLVKAIEAGVFNTSVLTQVHAYMVKQGLSLANICHKLKYPIVYCDCCGTVQYAHDTTTAYNGFYWVCNECLKGFQFCQDCNTYILTADATSASHAHAIFRGQGKLVIPTDKKVAAYNADVLKQDGIRPQFYKTENEIKLHARRCSMYTTDPERIFRYFGVELEVEKITGAPPDIVERTQRVLGEGFVMLKHDGSLSQHGKGGFEIVSMPATLEFHKTGVWKRFFNDLGPFFKTEPGTTGLHIHIGTATIPRIVRNKMLLFVNQRSNREFIFSMGNRNLAKANPNGRVYAGVKDWKLGDMMGIMQHTAQCPWNSRHRQTGNRYQLHANGLVMTDDWGNPIIASLKEIIPIVRHTCICPEGHYNIVHYEAFNLNTRRDTVEIRIFKGAMSEYFLYAALEFADGLADFCLESKVTELDYKRFIKWIEKRKGQYPNLFQLFVNQLWVDPPKAKPKSEDKKEQVYGLYA